MPSDEYKTGSQMIQLGNALIWFRNQELQMQGLTSSQFEIIRHLLTHQDMPVDAGMLMQELTLSQSTVAGILKRLEAKGLIKRQNDTSDARRDFVTLTEEGIKLEQSLKDMVCKTEKILLQGMSEPEQEAFSHLLSIALKNMNTLRFGKLK